MKWQRAVACFLTYMTTIVVCDGCGGPPRLNTQFAAWSLDSPARLARAHSWMQPGVANDDLLYISDGNGEVTVYRYWKRTLSGLLTGFGQPLGLCVDVKGNVFITDDTAQQILGMRTGRRSRLSRFWTRRMIHTTARSTH